MKAALPLIPRMSGANAEMYEPAMWKSPESTPSDPKMIAYLPCSYICWPKICAFAAICHGR
jgi:hypothetical protein